jgi:hypothetical protein
MSIPRPLRKTAGVLLACGFPLVMPSAAHATEDTAVASKASPDYVRTKRTDGSYQPETYAFGPGGFWGGIHDDSIDKMKFIDVARTVAGPLAAQNYLPAKDPDKATLLILVYWGTTAGTSGASSSSAYQRLGFANQRLSDASATSKAVPASAPGPGGDRASDKMSAAAVNGAARAEFDSAMAVVAMENRQRDKIDWQNAGILGYDAALAATDGLEFTALRIRRQDLIDEIEDDRYFVVLMAYDFQLLWKQKKHKLLWETRFSIRQRRNEFDKQLAAMAGNASRYFGQDTDGLIRKPIPEGRVKVGDLKVIGAEPEGK